MYGEPNGPSFLDNLAMDILPLFDDYENSLYDDDTKVELSYWEILEHSNDKALSYFFSYSWLFYHLHLLH